MSEVTPAVPGARDAPSSRRLLCRVDPLAQPAVGLVEGDGDPCDGAADVAGQVVAPGGCDRSHGLPRAGRDEAVKGRADEDVERALDGSAYASR